LVPTTLEEGLLREINEIAERYRHRCDISKIPARSRWTPAKEASAQPDEAHHGVSPTVG
jgi:UDP-sulfoquinovose synthase